MGRRKNWSAEKIISTLRQIEVQTAQGKGPGAGLQASPSRVVIGAWREHLYEIGRVKAASRAMGMSSDPG